MKSTRYQNHSGSGTLSDEGMIENIAGKEGAVFIGENSVCRGRLLTYGHGGKIVIGDWCYIGIRTEIWSMSSITIGDRVLISHNVNIHDGTGHSLDPMERHEHFRRIMEKGHPKNLADLPGVNTSPIVIENDVWINFGVTILKGVTIGSGSVIAAGSIVTSDVPNNVIYRNAVMPVIEKIR